MERKNIIKEIDGIIYRDVPYILFWWVDFYAVFYKNSFGMPKTVVPKYGSYHIETEIINYWWYDSEKEKKLREAEKNNTSLPPKPVEIYYDKIAK
jgi:microcin C transport system substrate-binding protein